MHKSKDRSARKIPGLKIVNIKDKVDDMVRWLSILSLTSLLWGSTSQVYGVHLAPEKSVLSERFTPAWDSISQQLANSSLSLDALQVEKVGQVKLPGRMEGVEVPGSASIALPLELLVSQADDRVARFASVQGEAAIGVGMDSEATSQPALGANFAYGLSSSKVRYIAMKLVSAKSPIYPLFATAFAGLFFRMRLLRGRRAMLAIPR